LSVLNERDVCRRPMICVMIASCVFESEMFSS